MDPFQDPEKMSDDDGFEIINDKLPIRSSSTKPIEKSNAMKVEVSVHLSSKKNAMIVSIKPPLKPASDIRHVPCDIVLVIDVSGSMSTSAPAPAADDGGKPENTGLSVLDLTKHAARTIIQTLNEKDRLGVVTFSNDAKVSIYWL
jgi:hypothetical protein